MTDSINVDHFKSCRMIDGKSKWVIVDEYGNIINKNPCKEKLKHLFIDESRPKEKYNKTNTCPKIKEDGTVCNNKLVYGHTLREYELGDWTGRYICEKCHKKYDHNSCNNIMKSLRNRRTGNLDPKSCAKGDMFEELTCKWIGVKNLNIENDNYRYPIDHSRDSKLGIIQTKGKFYQIIYRKWYFNTYGESHKEFDNIICYCANSNGKYIKRIYIFPKFEITKRIGITIIEKPNMWSSWYEKYRINDENKLKHVNDIWKEIIEMNNNQFQG